MKIEFWLLSFKWDWKFCRFCWKRRDFSSKIPLCICQIERKTNQSNEIANRHYSKKSDRHNAWKITIFRCCFNFSSIIKKQRNSINPTEEFMQFLPSKERWRPSMALLRNYNQKLKDEFLRSRNTCYRFRFHSHRMMNKYARIRMSIQNSLNPYTSNFCFCICVFSRTFRYCWMFVLCAMLLFVFSI